MIIHYLFRVWCSDIKNTYGYPYLNLSLKKISFLFFSFSSPSVSPFFSIKEHPLKNSVERKPQVLICE